MKKKKKIFILFSTMFVLILGVFSFVYLSYKDYIFNNKTFKEGVSINGIDVSNLTKTEAENVIFTTINNNRSKLDITLKYKDKTWNILGDDLIVDNQIYPYIDNVFNYYNSGNMFERKLKVQKLNGKNNFDISYISVLTGLNNKIDEICEQIKQDEKDAYIDFSLNNKNINIIPEKNGIIVDKPKLIQMLEQNLKNNFKVSLFVPTKIVEPKVLKETLLKNVVKRSGFFTDYSKSSKNRKHNVKLALSKFNGLKVEPKQQISFNTITGSRTAKNGYKKANIILGGVFVEGVGGGVCQASTTLYNALVLADLKIDEVNKHTLPVSYVPLGFDAMVSEDYSDLKFTNTTNKNIYIKTYYTDSKIFVDVYGEPLLKTEQIKIRTNIVEVLPHLGDKIIKDKNKEYQNKIIFKGEYLRLKYPKQGYHVKCYLDRYISNVLVETKLIRDVIYMPTSGIIVEGVEDLTQGLSLPKNNVKFIPPQNKNEINKININKKIAKENPSKYNP